MHLALRRYVDPAKDLFQYFGLGVAVAAIALAAIDERLDDVDDQEASVADVSQANHTRRVATAMATVHHHAYEAFPAWVMEHPDLACPGAWAELDVYVGGSSGFDPWGNRYQLGCDATGHFVAWSVGPDGVSGSADDASSR